MKQLKTENEVGSSMTNTIRYTFLAPGAIGKGRGRGLKYHRAWCYWKGRGRGLKSLAEKRNMQTKNFISQSSDLVNQYIQESETSSIGKGRGQGLKSSTLSTSQGMGMIHKKSMASEYEVHLILQS